MWCGVSTDKIIKLIFFDDKINSERYVQRIVHPFFWAASSWMPYALPNMTVPCWHHWHSWTVCGECLETQLLAVVSGQHTSPTFTYVWLIYGDMVYRWDPNTAEELNENIQNKVSLLSKMSIKTHAYNIVTDMPPVYEERENFQLLL